MNRRKRVIIFDDNRAHAEDLRGLLVSVTPPQWRRAGGAFDLEEDDVEIATSSAPYIATWLSERACDYELIVCDIHMGAAANEGALPLLKALGTLVEPPLLLVITERIAKVDDVVRRQIEDLAADPNNPVVCVVTSKHKAMLGVADPERQLEKAEWRKFFIRAVVNRSQPAEIKRLQRESRYCMLLQRLPTLKQAFSDCAESADRPLIVVVSESRGLLGSFASAWNNNVVFFRSLRPERFSDLLLEDSWKNLPKHDAVCIDDSDLLLRHALSEGGEYLREQLQFLLHRRIVSRPGGPNAEMPFAGQLILQVTPTLNTELSVSSDLYRDFPKVYVPAFTDLRARMTAAGRGASDGRTDVMGLVGFMLAAEGVAADSFDVAVMAAYDWSLGFNGQYAGVEAMRTCVQWMAPRAEDGRAPSRLVVERLTQSKEGRESIYASLDEAHLLLFILERLRQASDGPICLQAAAFLYFKLLCTTGAEREREDSARQFWGNGRLFEKLKTVHKFALKEDVAGWPKIADNHLYGWRDRDSSNSKSIGARLQERLTRNLTKHAPDAPVETWERIQTLWDSGAPGRKVGATQLSVLNEPYKA